MNPFQIATAKTIRIGWLLGAVAFFAYVVLSLVLFFQWVNPSLDGRTDQHIAADSNTYIYFAECIRAHKVPPYVAAALSSFPNTLWSPVLLALLFKSTLTMVAVNYAFLMLAIVLLMRCLSFSLGQFICLLLINATTTISLLSVNKEIIDLLVISLFLFAVYRQNRLALSFSFLLALFNRFEVCVVLFLTWFALSRRNPFFKRRWLSLVVLTIMLSVLLPVVESKNLAERFEEASGGHLIAILDSLEIHYLYSVAMVPKVIENLFGELIDVPRLDISMFHSDPANSSILLLNNLATLVVISLLIWRRALTPRSDLVYFVMIGFIVMGVSLVIQPRYFYFTYVLLCLHASIKDAGSAQVQNGRAVSHFDGYGEPAHG